MSELDSKKFQNTVLYLLDRCGDDRPGVMALVKMIWYADLWHYRKNLRTITGGEYLAMRDGPVLDKYAELFESLVDAEVLELNMVPVEGKKRLKQEYQPRRQPDLGAFTVSEIEILEEVLHSCVGVPGSRLSKRTHLEGPWTFVYPIAPNERIPRALFRWLENRPTEDDIDLAKRELQWPDVAESLRLARAG